MRAGAPLNWQANPRSCNCYPIGAADTAAAADRLTLVHRRIDRFDDRLQVSAVIGYKADADRQAQAFLSRVRCSGGRLQPLGDDRRLLETRVGKYDDEFVATEARDDVVTAQAAGEPLRHFLEQTIARVVPERIVHGFEAVEISKQA